MVVLATGNCGSGSWILGPGQLKTTARAAGIFFRAVENFCPGSQKFSSGQPENYGMGS